MGPRELRIGNIVMHPTVLRAPVIIPTKISPVQALERGYAGFLEDEIMTGIDVPYQHLAGVPVTEGLLKAIGFYDYGSKTRCMAYGGVLNPFVLELHGNNWYWEYSKVGIKCQRAIKHLHDLQNLYYALTDKEIEINITDIQ